MLHGSIWKWPSNGLKDFVAFGLLEYDKESLKMLQSILNVISTKKKEDQTQQTTASKTSFAHVNTGRGSDAFKERVIIELGSDIEQANQLDIELYAFARQLFLDRLKKFGTTVGIPKNTKDWNTTIVQLHSCPQVVSDVVPWYIDADKRRPINKRPTVQLKNQRKYADDKRRPVDQLTNLNHN
jgi:hypothetical protein